MVSGPERGEDSDSALDLQIRQHHGFQRSEWRMERVGWVMLAAFVAAGLAGLLGPGPLSHSTVAGPAGVVSVEHERLTHHEADDSITIGVSQEAIEADTLTIELTGTWWEGIDLSGIWPEPSAQATIPGGVALQFDVARPADVSVLLTFRAQQHGSLDATVTVPGDQVAFVQFVFP
jgi:hypothetical protein